jgi:hypothetical protein
MKRYEYKIERLPRIIHEDELNAEGREGWELLTVIVDGQYQFNYTHIFKKELK